MATQLNWTSSAGFLQRASAVTPGGVNSPVRAFKSVGGTPIFMAKGSGAVLTDVDGNDYLDLIGSWGPMLHGHAHPEIQAAVQHAVGNGTSFGTPTENEVLLATEIVARTSVEQVRLVTSGTEATMSAIRLARGFTGRNLVVKFSGCYHGHVDALLADAGSGVATLGIPGSLGVPEAVAADTLVLPYNDRSAVTAVFEKFGDQIACLITEAVPGNMGLVPPQAGFNQFLSQICQQHGSLFISDEVMTGFRLSAAGAWGLDGKAEGWQPDLVTFGKVMGGGFPAAAFGGRAEIMALLAPLGGVYQAGTLAGNPVAAAAGLANLKLSDAAAYQRLDQVATSLATEVAAALTRAGVTHQLSKHGNMFSVFFTDQVVTNYQLAQTQNTKAFAAFFHAMLQQGVYLPPSAFETWFVSTAITDSQLDQMVSAMPMAAAAAARIEQ